MRVCSDARVAHTCRSLACVRLFPHLRVAHTCRRLACVRLLRTADDAVIARRSQTSQDDVCATPGKLKERSERRKSRRVSGKRDSALPQSEIPRCARNDRAWLGMTGGWRMWGIRGVAHTCRRLACVRLFPYRGPCRHCRSFADIRRRCLGHPGKLRKSRRSLWEARLCASSERDSSLCSE